MSTGVGRILLSVIDTPDDQSPGDWERRFGFDLGASGTRKRFRGALSICVPDM